MTRNNGILLWAARVVSVAGMIAGLVVGPLSAATASCILVDVGLDPAIWNTARAPFLGKAVGQVFLAPDTLITRLTVWRPRDNRSVIGVHLFITAVDTTRTPPRPDTGAILLDGPTVHVYDSNPTGQLVEMSFAIDPPLALPRPGLYAFFLQGEDCDQGGGWSIIANDKNPYPPGIYWLTGRVSSPCYLRAVEGGEDTTDLLFNIEFCHTDGPTPVRGASWGQLKILYR